MSRTRLAALAVLVGVHAASTAEAGELLRAYELARRGDPQLAGAGANRLSRREGYPQARPRSCPS